MLIICNAYHIFRSTATNVTLLWYVKEDGQIGASAYTQQLVLGEPSSKCGNRPQYREYAEGGRAL